MPDVRGVAGDVLRVTAALKEGGVSGLVSCSSRPLRHAGPAVDDGRRGSGAGLRRAMPWAGKARRVAVELARRRPRRAPPATVGRILVWGSPPGTAGRPTRLRLPRTTRVRSVFLG